MNEQRFDALITSYQSGGVCLRWLTAVDTARWDTFVGRAEGGTFFHLSGWQRVISESLGHRTFYIFAELHGEMTRCQALPGRYLR